MQSLFRPFAVVESPVRSFIVVFLMFAGGLHIADDLRVILFYGRHTDAVQILELAALTAILTFGSRYLAQQKARKALGANVQR